MISAQTPLPQRHRRFSRRLFLSFCLLILLCRLLLLFRRPSPPLLRLLSVQKGSSIVNNNGGVSYGSIFSSSTHVKPTVSTKSIPTARKDAIVPPVHSKMDISPSKFNGLSVSMDETMEILMEMGTTNEKIVDLDVDFMDPQLCATMAYDIYQHLRASEAKKRPSIDFMEKIQKDINPSMRAILIDWLVEVAEEYRLVPDTLYLTINYIDRYLSGNLMDRQRLQLLGVACMMIASKYEEICAPQVEEFCYITDNTYFKDEVLQMESSVLNFLKFEMTAATSRCFLRRFVRAAQGVNEV